MSEQDILLEVKRQKDPQIRSALAALFKCRQQDQQKIQLYKKKAQQLQKNHIAELAETQEKINKIVNGQLKLSVEDCQPQECFTSEKNPMIPQFWGKVLSKRLGLQDKDAQAMSSLMKLKRTEDSEGWTKLDFSFGENIFFTNKLLTKKVKMDGQFLLQEQCKIDWKKGQDLIANSKTVKKVKQVNKKGQTRIVQKVVNDKPSFFQFFAKQENEQHLQMVHEIVRQMTDIILPSAMALYLGFQPEESESDQMNEGEFDQDEENEEDDEEDEDQNDAQKPTKKRPECKQQ